MTNGQGSHQLLHGIRKRWREHIKPLWRFLRAPVLLVLAIAVLVLGTIGYGQWSAMPVHHAHYGILDSIYHAITLFAFAGGVDPPVPVTLEIARILGPVLTGYAAIGTILVLSRQQAQLLAIRMLLRRHVLIAGLGYTGSHLALELIDREPVVVIEANPSNERIAAVRARGVRVLVGDATDPLILRQAGLRSCRQVVACCGGDGASIDVATAAANDLGRRRFHPLTTCIHLNDLKLWQSLAAESVPLAPHDKLRLEYSNVLVLAAELMLDRDKPFGSPADPATAPRTAHILFVGTEGPGEQLILKAARLWRTVHPDGADGLRITVTGRHAEREVRQLRERHPQIDEYCELLTLPLEIDSAEFQSGCVMFGPEGCIVTRAYVCLLDEGDGMLAALALHSQSAAAHVPVTVIVDDEKTGVGFAIEKASSRGDNIRPFGVLSETATDALLLRGTNEIIARAKHEQWLRDERAKNSGSDSSFLKNWDELTEQQRDDNRRFADDVIRKLDAVNCMLVPNPLPDRKERRFKFTDEEVEELAIREHDRWFQARRDAGWRYGDPRDDARKLHPLMVSWEKLSEDDRNKDRDPVKELPEMLERAGLKIQRRSRPLAPGNDGSATPIAASAPDHPAVDEVGDQLPTGHAR